MFILKGEWLHLEGPVYIVGGLSDDLQDCGRLVCQDRHPYIYYVSYVTSTSITLSG